MISRIRTGATRLDRSFLWTQRKFISTIFFSLERTENKPGKSHTELSWQCYSNSPGSEHGLTWGGRGQMGVTPPCSAEGTWDIPSIRNQARGVGGFPICPFRAITCHQFRAPLLGCIHLATQRSNSKAELPGSRTGALRYQSSVSHTGWVCASHALRIMAGPSSMLRK